MIGGKLSLTRIFEPIKGWSSPEPVQSKIRTRFLHRYLLYR